MSANAASPCRHEQHLAGILGQPVAAAQSSLLRVGSRRWFLQTGLLGFGGLALGSNALLRGAPTSRSSDPRSVILFWLSGGPSQIDTWDPKPDAPAEIRGPYGTIASRVPGIRVCEHLPLQASIMNQLTILRSVDCSASDHTPITLQAGNALARRTNDGRDGGGYPSMGSVAARFRGSNQPPMPAFIGLADSTTADVWGSGHLGNVYDPVWGRELPGRLAPAPGVSISRLQERTELRRQFARLERAVESESAMGAIDRHAETAYSMVLSGHVQRAFALDREPERVRDAYGRCSVGEKALLARRLVEAGCTFVVVSGRWGYFDHHGDTVPPWGGILRGLTPILPTIDRALHALILDLEGRGLLDSTLILMLGEFGRSPVLTADGGRNHWPRVMSMLLAGGGLRHGQLIGRTDARGGDIAQRPVSPSDLAATVYQHLRIPVDSQWLNPQGRPMPIVTEAGRPIAELG